MKYSVSKVTSAVAATIFGAAIATGTSASSLNQNAATGKATQEFNQFVSSLPKRYIIQYKNDNSLQANGLSRRASVKAKAVGLGAKIKQEFANINVISAELDAKAIKALKMDSNVVRVEEDFPRRLMAQTVPYGIGLVQADQVDDTVAAASAGGKKVCIIDSGLDLPHEDMGSQGGTINGTNDSGTGNWHDHGGPHGTHVAGTIGALNNGIGVRGVIGSDVSMHIVKVFNESGWGYSSSLASAVNTCVNNGADVINMSLGGSGSSTTEANAMQSALDAGVLLIAAAGNDGNASSTTDAMSYPASYDAVMSVAAIDSEKALADFSQKNSQVEISGPGVNVYSTYPEGTGSVVELTVGSTGYSVNGMENQGSASGALYNFGTGESTNSGASGKVCLIERGNISFHDKVKNCENSGGVGAIIYNNVAGELGATLGDTNTTSIPAVAASQANGQAMLNQLGQNTSLNIGPGNYGKMSGTSMASPHVAGVATLVWSHHPSCTATQIRAALNATAEDLGAAGRDVKFGYGLVQTKTAIDYITANGCDGNGNGGGGGGSNNQLENGVAVNNLSGAKGEQVKFTLEVPAGASDLSFAMSGGTGDADLYVKFGSEATTSSYDCRPYKGGNAETCTISNVQSGTYHVMLNGYSSFSGVSLIANFTENNGGGGSDDVLENGVAKTSLSAAKDAEVTFTMEVPAGASDLSFVTTGGSGDADMYVKFGSAPTTSSYDCRPYKSGNEETCNISNVQAGTYYVTLRGYSAFSGVSLTGSYSEGGNGGGAASFENSDNYSIPDNNSTGISSPISSTRSGASNTVTVDVNIIHTYKGDLVVDLIHPDGTVFNLHNRTGSSTDNIVQSYSVNVGSKDSAGTWNLRVKDMAGQDTGYIDSWKLSFE
ncbi:S8 family serine peptidase [Aliikangiella sp. G2MR2-5]|uniref:S8 family serine peptidase n=1 Tax=Aliikangiella sp. G2MR2-5 TaxID=2788943 RepID=UPI0018A95EB1|nr:S8 family serine peptidase [Aliikangiella sp. G2MR2-5]